jgi:acyl-CoA thioesterase-1
VNRAHRGPWCLVLLVIFLSTSCLAQTGTGRTAQIRPLLPQAVAAGYVLAWHDEFDGSALDKAEWKIRTGERFASDNTARNVSVGDGLLRLAVRKEKSGKSDYTAGGVISKREFKYGYYEARYRVPRGAGWHTSFWMMKNTPGGDGNRQEIDVCEQDSKELTSYGMNLHIHKPEHVGQAGRRVKTPDLSADFHVWGCEFSPREIRNYFDGKLVGVTHVTNFQHDVMSIWLTTVGWAKLPWAPQLKIDDSALPASADFDYVRFFEKPALENEAPAKPRTVVVFGDSITEGGALPKDQRDNAWVRVVERESKGALRMVNEGKGGRPSASVPEFETMMTRHPRMDQLVIALGTNDSRDITDQCAPKAIGDVRRMIERARATYGPALPVLLVGPPNINKSALIATKPIANEREAKLRELGDAFSKLAAELRCEFAGTFGIVPEASMTKDGVHPDAAGNAAMAKVILSKLLP